MGEDGRCWAAVAWGYPKALAGKECWDSRPLISARPCGRPKSGPEKISRLAGGRPTWLRPEAAGEAQRDVTTICAGPGPANLGRYPPRTRRGVRPPPRSRGRICCGAAAAAAGRASFAAKRLEIRLGEGEMSFAGNCVAVADGRQEGFT